MSLLNAIFFLAAASVSAVKEADLGGPEKPQGYLSRFPDEYSICGRVETSVETGNVLKCINHRTGSEFAAKSAIIGGSMNKRYREALDSEVKVLSLIKHPNIVEMIQSFAREDGAYEVIVLELGTVGSVWDNRDLVDEMPPSKILSLFRQVGSAVQYLHSRKVAHRDIKSENVVLFAICPETVLAKLIDFEFSTIGTHESSDQCGTVLYWPPELVKCKLGEKVNVFAHDVWSLAIFFYRFNFGEYPWKDVGGGEHIDLELLERNIVAQKIAFAEGNVPGMSRLLCAMLVRNPLQRPAMNAVMSSLVFSPVPQRRVRAARLTAISAPSTPRRETTSSRDCQVDWESFWGQIPGWMLFGLKKEKKDNTDGRGL